MAAQLGLRVVRGPDWEGGDQDGGEGFVGTVVELEEGSGIVKVQWDAGLRQPYHCGRGGKYELRILDNAPTGVQHSGCMCSWCSCKLITGTLWQCVQCYKYHLCSQCYHDGKHCLEHEFERVNEAGNEHVRVGSRMLEKRVASQGIFPGAVVMRGADWHWGDQDGGIGCQGKVVAIDDWVQTSFRSVAHVSWSHSQVINVYCIGHLGRVDLQCVTPSTGGYYYPEHLAILGKQYVSSEVEEEKRIRAGDGVRVELDPELFKIAQEGHGGWEDSMAEYIGCDGMAVNILYSGDVIVRYKNNRASQMNRNCLTLVEEYCSMKCGDVVRVCDDMSLVHRLQTGHGEWADDMALSLGQVGRVLTVRGNGDIRVAVNGSRWVFNPKCLTPAPGEMPIEERTGQIHVDITVRIQCLSLTDASCADVVVVTATGGDLKTLTSYLQEHPEHVNRLYDGRAAIHAAVVESYLPIVRYLITQHADLNIKNEGGFTALHLCAYLNNHIAAELLLESGADVNIKDDRGISPLALATISGHMDMVRVLLDQPRINVDIQDLEGDSPLHRAVRTHQLPSLIALLDSGADPKLLNHRLFNCMHIACQLGFTAGVEELMKWYPDLINVAMKDGLTALHLAAANGCTDIVSVLASHPNCDINVKTTEDHTPLHIAAYLGYTVMLERLVGYGADFNTATIEGNTALHVTLACKTMTAPSQLSPQILEVKRELDKQCGPDILKPNVIVGVFLVREGANIHAVNQMGVHPLYVHPPDVAQLVTSYAAGVNTKPPFHGKLLNQMKSPFADVSPRTPHKPLRVVSSHAPLFPTTPLQPAITTSDSLPTSKTMNQWINRNTNTTTLYYDKDINPYAKMTVPSVMDDAGGTYRLEPCSLCEDNPVSTMFQPCGHVTLCHECGTRAKRCMKEECRAGVMKVIRLCPVCLKNHPDETHSACNEKHKLCRGCILRSSSKCLLCCAVIE